MPKLSGRFMAGGDYSGLDFTSDFESESGPFTSELLGADFRNAKLIGCDLSRADLASANLRGSDLRSANLAGANLYTTLLEDSNLEGANLTGANLISAEMQGVRLAGADLEGARFGQTSIGGVDLSAALNLDLATHFRPSAVSSDSLRLTASGLATRPEPTRREVFRFLSNSGVDEELLSVVRSWIGKPIEFHSVFLSHSSLDKAFARRLYSDLRNVGVNCWFDEKEILPGDSILDMVDHGIKVWEKLLLVCSRNSLSTRTGWWVEQELERALAKERALRSRGEMGSTLIPITIDNYVFDGWNSKFQASVVDKHVGDFRQWQAPDEYATAFERLRKALDASRQQAH